MSNNARNLETNYRLKDDKTATHLNVSNCNLIIIIIQFETIKPLLYTLYHFCIAYLFKQNYAINFLT